MISANFDYEIELFSGKRAPKVNEELEYLYWWSEDKPEPLYTSVYYDQAYLDYLQIYISEEIQTSKKPPVKNWWGELNNSKLEKLLNSKITSTQFATLNNLCHPKTKIVSKLEELQFVPDEMYVLKNPYMMSGKGFLKFAGKDFESKALEWTKKQFNENHLIFEPWLKKYHDFSTYIFFQDQKMETYFNLSNDQGNYKGTVVYADPTQVFEDLENRGINLDYYLESLALIRDYYQLLGAKSGLSIDSFTYEDEGTLKTYYLSEVNYRKTMGWVCIKLRKFLQVKGMGQLLMKKREKKWDSFEDYKKIFSKHLYQTELKRGILLLSPHNNNFMTFFIAAHNKEELENYLSFIANL